MRDETAKWKKYSSLLSFQPFKGFINIVYFYTKLLMRPENKVVIIAAFHVCSQLRVVIMQNPSRLKQAVRILDSQKTHLYNLI